MLKICAKCDETIEQKHLEVNKQYFHTWCVDNQDVSVLPDETHNYRGGCPSGKITKKSPISASATDENINGNKAHSQDNFTNVLEDEK